jgi:hypothetical protein
MKLLGVNEAVIGLIEIKKDFSSFIAQQVIRFNMI